MSDRLDRISKLSHKRLALLVMDLQSKLDAAERQRTEPIAIIGLGCRVPGADDPEAFWRLLRDGVDGVREVPADRWDVDAHYDPDPDAPGRMSTRWGGFLDHVDLFDPRFFGIAPRDAVSMDPQHRLILEVAWEALEDAGQSPSHLSGSRTGVFVGITASDYARRVGQADLEYLDNYILTGTGLNFVAGRLSYVLGLQGPSLAVDTAGSSSLVAVHLACQSLRSGESRMALAGGVNAILTPDGTIATSKARMLARDGRCKTFDAAADGIVRGEGCGVVVLKRLSDALAAGDRVLALVRGSAVNQDGASGGLTVPNGVAQQALLREALARSGVKPAEVDYVEAHGAGTGLGDPIEVRALAAVLGQGRDRSRPVKIGSVKTNLGHLEPASGVVGLIKTVLALQHEEIPPHLHLKNLTPHIDWQSVPVVVPTVRTPWPANAGRRIAGVSSFGFSGTNAHVVLEEAPVVEERPAAVERPLHVLTASAKTEGALRELVGRLSRHLPEHPSLGLADVCFSANAGRGHFAHRLAVRAESREELTRRLAESAEGRESEGVLHAHVPGSERPKVAFLFTGQGSQYAGMGRGLYETQPTFRKALEHCQEMLRGQLARPLLSAMYPAPGDEGLLDETAYAQPALFALEYALAELWRSWGIAPSWVMGHGVGEYAAACVAGVFSLEDGLRLAFHSALVPVRDDLSRAAGNIVRSMPRLGLVSNRTGRPAGAEITEADYWSRPLREPVRFTEGKETLREQGCGIFIEIGPLPTLLGTGQRCLPEGDRLWLPSLRRGRDDWSQMLESLSSLYVRGAEVDWAGFDRDYPRRKVALPTYPFQRDRYWVAAAQPLPAVKGPARAGGRDRVDEVKWPQRQLRPVPRDTELPLSFAQQRLWFLDQMEAGAAYNLSWAARLVGPLDTAAIEASLDEVVRRHEALRTVFPAAEGRPTQLVQAGLRIPLSRVDLGASPETDRVGAASRWATAEAQRPFDLARGPLLRASLLHLGEDDHALVLTLHHIVTDGWSMEVLVGELTVLYDAFTRGAPSPLPELPIQYADFAHWQRQWLQGKVLEDQLSYWRRRLGGSLPVLELPTDRPRPATRTYRGATHALVLPGTLAGELHSFSQREGVTLFMTLVAALQVLLYRYAGQDDVVIGFSVANRNRAELEALIGFFVNNLVLRTDLSGNPPFRELLARVKNVALDAYDHQDLPFEKLVEELHPQRDLAQNPIFQVMVDVQSAARKELRLSGLTLTPIETETKVARFDLEIHFWESAEQLAMVFHYNTDLFDAATIERMAAHYLTLLEGAAQDAQRRLSELPLLTGGERGQVLLEWNATGRDYLRETSLSALFEAQVERTPEAVAVGFEGKLLTYRELNREANRLANYLVSLGVGPEVRVGICVERSLEMVVGLLGILKAGGAYVPLDPTYPEDRVAFMLADADVPVLLTQARLSAALPAHRARVIHLDAGDDDAIAQSSDENPGIRVDSGNLAYVIYTSGSTGRPKGAMNTQAGICNRLFWMQEEYGLTEADRVLQKTPFSFDVSVWEFFWPLIVGARLVVAKPGGHQDPAYLARFVRDEGVTTIHFVPSMLRAFLDEPAVSDLDSLRRVICSGEALSYDLQERFFARMDVPLHNLYGPTEAAVDVTRWACRRGDQRAVVPIGEPIANTQAYVLDEAMGPVPRGVTGELYLGGVQVGRGYHNRPDLTAERFVPHPFSAEPGQRLYRTGDLARHLPDGQIEFRGRVDHQVKVRGFRIELGEIESVLGRHPGVKDAAVVVRENDPGDKRLVAYVVWRSGSVTSVELRSWLGDRLPGYMVPSAVVDLPALPLGSNHKLDRKALAAHEEPPSPAELRAAPQGALENVIGAVWREVLRVGEVGIDDNFFDAGGNSLLLVRARYRLEQILVRPVTVAELFRQPTIRTLAAFLESPANVDSRMVSARDRARARRSIPPGRPRATAAEPPPRDLTERGT